MLLAFQGISRPVSLIDSADLVACLPAVLRGWRFAEAASSITSPPVISIRKIAKGYSIEAPWRSPPVRHRDKVDVICTFVADLIRAFIDEDRSLLCLHSAAAEFAGKLVVFPNTYRAGKSLFTAYLAAAGVRVYGDDVLPIRGPENKGVAPGIGPRLRLPLPEGASPAFLSYIERRRGLGNRRYLYLDAAPEEWADHGAEAPVGAFVLLERCAKAKTGLLPMGRSEMLKRVVVRNFAREVQAVDILSRLQTLVDGAECHTLRYADAEKAAALLKDRFSRWPKGPRRARPSPAAKPARRVGGNSRGRRIARYARNGEVLEKPVENELFLVNPRTGVIYQLNAIGAALWRLLAQPMELKEAVRLLQDAFPEVARTGIAGDVKTLMSRLAAKGLVITSRYEKSLRLPPGAVAREKPKGLPQPVARRN